MVKLFDLNKSQVSSLAIRAGNLIFCRDDGDILFDTADNTRISMKDNIIFLSSESIRQGLLAPLPNKIYCVLDSGRMYLYDGSEWLPIGSNNFVIIPNAVIDPTGWSNNTYTVTDDKIKYFHNVQLVFDLSVQDLATDCGISIGTVADGSFTLTCTTTPTYPLYATFFLQ